MNEESELIYREEQKFSLWIRWLIVPLIALALHFSILLKEITSQQGWPDIQQILTVIIGGIFVPIAVALLIGMVKLQTQVRGDGLYVRFFPFHFHFKRFTAKDLSQYYARQYRPILEYGGWGIRGSFGKGWVYNVSGNKGVQLVFKNGKQLLIGSQRSEELQEAIRSIIQSN